VTIPSTIRLREGEQPGTAYEGFEVGASLGPVEFTIDAGIADAWLELHEGDGAWYRAAGGIVPSSVLSLYLLPVLYQRYPPLQGIVLTRQQFAFHRPLRAGEPLTAAGRVVEKYERRGRQFIRWSAEFRTADGTLVVDAANSFMLPSAEARAPDVAAMSASDPALSTQHSALRGSPRLVTQETINRYGELNGDNDIVHYDDAFARAVGFRAPIAHGLMALGYLAETLREAWGTAWLTSGRLDIRWTAPIYPGDRITPGARITRRDPAEGVTRLTAEVWCDDQHDRVVLSGSASVLFPGDG
jgi:acyl dehydratase